MKQVSAEEFSRGEEELLMGKEPFDVMQEGQVIGIYRPLIDLDALPRDRRFQQRREAAQQLEATLRQAAETNGLTVEELKDLLVGDLP